MALGFWDIPGAFSVVGEFARVGGATVFDLEDQDKVAPQSSPKKGASAAIFFGWEDLVFTGGFGENCCLDVVFWW